MSIGPVAKRPEFKRGPTPPREPLLAQIASFVGFFAWLLTFKTFFLPLFIIPTGSMAQTLAGANAMHTCPNCGWEYQVGFHRTPGESRDPAILRCPNCRWVQRYHQTELRKTLRPTAGDRIVVHGWPFVLGGPTFGPQHWDVVVFKNPNDPAVNFIKRLIGLPGEKIEIIDGDIFINDRISRKPDSAQHSLWFPYFSADYPPREPGQSGYRPRWAARTADGPWRGLETRRFTFDGAQAARAEIAFVTATGANGGGAFVSSDAAGEVIDMYGYNQPLIDPDSQHFAGGLPPANVVRDVRLSATVTIGAGEGYVELGASKYADGFAARLYADGRVTLEHVRLGTEERTAWGEARIAPGRRGVRFALSNVDYRVRVAVDGRVLLESSDAQYSIDPGAARTLGQIRPGDVAGSPLLRVAAERVQAGVEHVLIERDVYYTQAALSPSRRGHGTRENPLTLGAAEYFVLGDNSPSSHDGRLWEAPGPHLRDAYKAGTYQAGTVPADQMIGRAFLVYWPGFLPLFPGGPNFLPDLGRVRWIR